MKAKNILLQPRLIALVLSSTLLLTVLWFSGIANVAHELLSFPLWGIGLILVLLLINLQLVSFRLWRILDHFGVAVPWRVASRASISGHMAGLFVTSLFGQALGRQSVLRNHAIRPVLVASLTAYERTILIVISALFGLAGAFFLLTEAVVFDFLRRIPFIEISIAIFIACFFSLYLGRSHFETRLAARFQNRKIYLYFLEISGITIVGQLTMLMAFVVGILAKAPDVSIVQAFAAAAAISFAASIPVTVSGWGIRELASVYILGKLGVPHGDAIAISVMVGICATLVILVAGSFSLRRKLDGRIVLNSHSSDKPPQSNEIEKIASWVLAMCVGVFVFFQMHVDLTGSGSVINLNLADPFAVLALAAVTVNMVFTRHKPRWRVASFNAMLIAITVLLFAGVAHGIWIIGATQWALGGRALGWLILLGYVSAGYMLAGHAGGHGVRRLVETMVAVGAAITLLQVLLRLFDRTGLGPALNLPANFEGYAANRNAFAFQLLVCSILVLAYSSVKLRERYSSINEDIGSWKIFTMSRTTSYAALLGILLMGLWLSNSRAGLISMAVILVAAWFGRLADRKTIIYGLNAAVLLTLAVMQLDQLIISTADNISSFLSSIAYVISGYLSSIANFFSGGTGAGDVFTGEFARRMPSASLQSQLSLAGSDHERAETVARGLAMWRESPIFGSGVGVFAKHSIEWIGYPSVIHSTPVWILAELGTVGAAIFGWAFFVLIKEGFKMGVRRPARRMILLMLLGFAVFSLVHEMLFQRIFWLVLGVALGLPDKKVRVP